MPPGAGVWLGGMLLSRRPVAFCRALAETGVGRLTVIAFTTGVETEVLLEAGAVSSIRACYAGLEIYGPAPLFRSAVEAGSVSFVDETEVTVAAGLQAAVLGLDWFPSARAIAGTDYPSLRSDIRVFADPLSGRELIALPAIEPDVAVIHAPWADDEGNAILFSAPAVDTAAACATPIVIVTADQLVSAAELRSIGPADLLGFQVSHVVEAPSGASPSACLPHYEHDRAELLRMAGAT